MLRDFFRRWLGVDQVQDMAEMAELMAREASKTASEGYNFAIEHVQQDHQQQTIGGSAASRAAATN